MTLAQRIEALLERLASQSWCDTAHHAEARALLARVDETKARRARMMGGVA